MEQLCLFLLWSPIPWYIGVTGSFSQYHVSLETLSLCSLAPDTSMKYGVPDLFLSKFCEFNQKRVLNLSESHLKWKAYWNVFLVPNLFASEEIWIKIFKEVFLFLCASYLR